MNEGEWRQAVLDRLDRLIQIKEEQVYPESQFKPLSEPPIRSPATLEVIEPTSQPLVQPMQSLEQALASEGVDVNLLDISDDEKTVKPTEFLGDRWTKPNAVLQVFGYNWLSDGPNGRWIKGEPPRSSSPSPTWKAFPRGNGEWIFAKDQQGNLHPETANLYNELMELGQAKVVGSYRYKISGDKDQFLQRFPVT